MRTITNEIVLKFKRHLIEEEKSENTIEKYIRDITFFMAWLCGRKVTKILALEYKKALCEKYAPRSVNAAISSLNSFFGFMEWNDIRIKAIKMQKQIFANKDKELTKMEYERLLTAAENNKNYIILCKPFVQQESGYPNCVISPHQLLKQAKQQ